MTMTMRPIEKASDDELRLFAEQGLAIDTERAKTRADIIALIQQTWQLDDIPVEAAPLHPNDQDDDTVAPVRQEIPALDKFPDPRFLVIIHSTHLPGGAEPVPLGCNGDVVVVNRDAEVPIPYRFMDSLRNAFRETLIQNPQTQEITRSRYSAYPFQILEPRPSKAEIEEFRRVSSQWTLGGDNSEFTLDKKAA